MAEQLVGKISTLQISDVLTEPLSLTQNLDPLLTLNDIVRTCYGPRGRLKAVQNKDGGTVVITSSSTILFHRISPSNPFVRLIFACVKSHLSKHNDFGLLTALTVTTLLLSSLRLNVPKILVSDLNDHIIKLCFEYFNSERCSCKVQLRLDDVSQLLSVIRTVINSKPGCVLSKDEKNHLALLLLKTFLNVVPNRGKIMGRIEIITQEGVNVLNSNVFCGLLIPCQSNTEAICDKNGKRNFKLLLFATSLSGDAKFCVDKLEVHADVSVWNEVFCELNNLFAKIIENDIDIVACQKVIHPLLKEQLESAGILVFDRLGADLSHSVQELTRACPIETLLFPEDLNVLGNVTSIEVKKINKKTYVNLQSNNTIWTLLICHNFESALNETNIICRQAIDTLYRLINSRRMSFGAGCTESSLAAYLYKKINNTVDEMSNNFRCSKEQVLIVAENFVSVVYEIAVSVHSGKIYDFKIDNIHNHLWNFTSELCMCGQFSKVEIPTATWTDLSNLHFHIDENIKPVSEIKKDIILDEFIGKKQAYSSAFEITSLLLRTGICIIDKN